MGYDSAGAPPTTRTPRLCRLGPPEGHTPRHRPTEWLLPAIPRSRGLSSDPLVLAKMTDCNGCGDVITPTGTMRQSAGKETAFIIRDARSRAPGGSSPHSGVPQYFQSRDDAYSDLLSVPPLQVGWPAYVMGKWEKSFPRPGQKPPLPQRINQATRARRRSTRRIVGVRRG